MVRASRLARAVRFQQPHYPFCFDGTTTIFAHVDIPFHLTSSSKMDNKLSFKTTPLPTSDSKTYSSLEELVSRVGFLGLSGDVYNDLYKLLPLVRVDQDEQLTDREKLLSSFFRCRHDLNDCSFAADNDDELVDHLSVDHDDQALFCVYCPRDDQDENKHDVSFKNAQELVCSHLKFFFVNFLSFIIR